MREGGGREEKGGREGEKRKVRGGQRGEKGGMKTRRGWRGRGRNKTKNFFNYFPKAGGPSSSWLQS